MWGLLVRTDFFARLETDCFARGNRDFCTSSWIPADTAFPWFHYKHTEASKLYSLSMFQGILKRSKESVNRDFSLNLRYPFLLSNTTHYILFYHGAYPFLTCLQTIIPISLKCQGLLPQLMNPAMIPITIAPAYHISSRSILNHCLKFP